MGHKEGYISEEKETFEEAGGGEVGGGRELWTILWEAFVRWDSGYLDRMDRVHEWNCIEWIEVICSAVDN